jgi:hypothetical protein
MNETVLAELRNLAHERGYESPFASQVEFEKWADQVAPRLQFDLNLAARFVYAAKHVRSNYASGYDPLGSTNEAVGLLNQAILLLEQRARASPTSSEATASKQPPPSLELPPKITLKWLYGNAPLSLYVWLGSLVVGAFLAGIVATETPLYRALRPQSVEGKESAAPPSPSAKPSPRTASAAT